MGCWPGVEPPAPVSGTAPFAKLLQRKRTECWQARRRRSRIDPPHGVYRGGFSPQPDVVFHDGVRSVRFRFEPEKKMSITGAPSSSAVALARNILDGVDDVVCSARDESKPLEIDPYRDRLFELFVTAEAAGLTAAEAEPDLTSDGLCRALAERWGLREAAQTSMQAADKLAPDRIDEMRLLWSVMRMWMEWTYAWKRWEEFHAAGKPAGAD